MYGDYCVECPTPRYWDVKQNNCVCPAPRTVWNTGTSTCECPAGLYGFNC
jgi:hypothetical protein